MPNHGSWISDPAQLITWWEIHGGIADRFCKEMPTGTYLDYTSSISFHFIKQRMSSRRPGEGSTAQWIWVRFIVKAMHKDAQSLCIEIHWTGWSCMPYLSRISPLLVSRPSTRAIFEFVEPSPMAFPTRSWGAFGSQKSDHILYYWVGGWPLLLSTNIKKSAESCNHHCNCS